MVSCLLPAGESVYLPYSKLMTPNIINASRSKNRTDSIKFVVDVGTCNNELDKVGPLLIRCQLDSMPTWATSQPLAAGRSQPPCCHALPALPALPADPAAAYFASHHRWLTVGPRRAAPPQLRKCAVRHASGKISDFDPGSVSLKVVGFEDNFKVKISLSWSYTFSGEDTKRLNNARSGMLSIVQAVLGHLQLGHSSVTTNGSSKRPWLAPALQAILQEPDEQEQQQAEQQQQQQQQAAAQLAR